MKKPSRLTHHRPLNKAVATLTAALLGLLMLCDQAWAEKMNSDIHTLVIQKLEQALKQTHEDQNLSLRPVRARLADLYAERARLRAMEEASQDCQKCTGALDDRRRSLALYKTVIQETKKENRGPLLLQMAHLHELNGEPMVAAQIDEQIISEGERLHSPAIVAEALIGRAELRFGHGDMILAQKDFESALKLVDHSRQGPILHRIAWCYLNKGDQVLAVRTLVHILQTPALLQTDRDSDEIDEPLQEDVTRDLATFFARGTVGAREIGLLESLSPKKTRKEILKHFASECERLGQKKAAIEVWAVVVKYEGGNTERLEALIHVAQIRYELGEKSNALEALKEAIAFWKKYSCDETMGETMGGTMGETKSDGTPGVCEVLHLRLRSINLAWHRAEKRQPSALLLDADLVYLSLFVDDMELTEWAAEAAHSLKRYAIAASLFHRASLLASVSKEKSAPVILESSLFGEVEMAERSRDARTREASYDHYLQLNPHGAIAAKVRYQRAHVAYERGNMMNEASGRFHDFAASSDCARPKSKETAQLCVQAADLDLDALASLNDHQLLESRSLEYSHLFPARQKEYLKISRTSVLKQAEGASRGGQLAQAMAKINEVNLTGATSAERVQVYKMRLAIAEQRHDLAETSASAQMILQVHGLSASDRELALAKQEWVAEMNLDFTTAFAVAKQMKFPQMSAANRVMKMALLAELSGHDPSGYETAYLRLASDERQKILVEAKLVRDSRQPLKELAKYESSLKRNPALYATLVLEIELRTGSENLASHALKIRGVAQTPAGRLLAERLLLREFLPRDQKLSQHHLAANSDAQIRQSLAERLKLLGGVEAIANQAINSHDWALQLITLTTLSRENARLYNEIIALPVPKKLAGAGRANYVRLVEESARGYMHRSEQISKKLALLWGEYASQQNLLKELQEARPEFRPLVVAVVQKLVQIAPAGIDRELAQELKTQQPVPSESEIATARQEAKQRPFQAEAIEKLRNLEDERGRETMVAYLDQRLLNLKSGERR